MKGIASSVAVSVAYGAALAQALTPVTTKGNAFFAGNERFYIRGIDYQPGGSDGTSDPLADAASCKRDIVYFKQLGINTIRVYNVDNTANHDDCMKALDAAGIYLAVDVNTPKYSLSRSDPRTSYNDVYLGNVFATMEAFSKYDNTLLFFAGNEVINNAKNSDCAPYVKAVVRDMKMYRSKQKLRQIPVGYSAADVQQNREQTAQYLNCGDEAGRSEFFAFNDYSWCDPSSFTTSGWDQKVETYKDYSIPLFLSEYGCNAKARKFEEVASLYSQSQMTSVYSGGLVFEYSEEGDNFGLVDITGNKVTPQDDFGALKSALAKTPAPSGPGGFHQGSPSKCPAASSMWEVHTEALPAVPSPAVKYFTQGAPKGAGLSGSGSQTAGTPSVGFPGDSSSGGSSGSGSGSGSGEGAGEGAAASLHIPAIMGLAALVSSLFGSSLL